MNAYYMDPKGVLVDNIFIFKVYKVVYTRVVLFSSNFYR